MIQFYPSYFIRKYVAQVCAYIHCHEVATRIVVETLLLRYVWKACWLPGRQNCRLWLWGTFWWPDQHLKINWLVLGRGNMGVQTEDTSRHPVLAVAIWGVVNWVKRTADTFGSWHPLILECWKLHLNTLWNQPLTHTGDLEGWYEGYIGLSRQ